MDERAPDYEAALADMAETLHRLALRQVTESAATEDSIEREALETLARKLDSETVQLFYQIAITGRRDLPLAPDPRSGFEMVLLRMHAFEPARAAEGSEPAKSRPASKRQSPERRTPPANAGGSPKVTQPKAGEAAHEAAVADWTEPDWNKLVGELSIQGAARQLAANCVYAGRSGSRINLTLAAGNEHLLTDKVQRRLAKVLGDHFGQRFKLNIKIGQPGEETLAASLTREEEEKRARAAQAIASDPNINALVEAFDAEVQSETIKPVV